MSIKKKFKRYFEFEDDVVEEEVAYTEGHELEEEEPSRRTRSNGSKTKDASQNVVSLQSVQKTAKVILLEPRTYDEAQEIADQLKNRKAVIINLQRISHDQAKRVVDFLSGTVYAIGGDIQKLGSSIFLCTPDNVDVTGSISEMVQEFES